VCAHFEDHREHNVMRIEDIMEDSEKNRSAIQIKIT
jgi:hypothetical protein